LFIFPSGKNKCGFRDLVLEPSETASMPIDVIAETAEHAPKVTSKRRIGREPLGFAYFGLVLFIIVYFARPEDWIPGLSALPLAKISGILILGSLAFSFQAIRWRMPQEITFLALMVAQLWLSAILSPVWKGGAVNAMLDFSKVLPLVIVIYGVIRSPNRLRFILFVQAASVAGIAIASVASRHMSGGRLQGILSGGYSNPNDLALIIDISLPLSLALALTTRSAWKKFAWAIAMLGMVYAVILTASRGGAIALGVAALVCLWHLGVKSRRFYLLLLIPIAAVVLLIFSGNTLQERFEQTDLNSAKTKQQREAAGSAEQRKELLLKSLEVTAHYPLFGIGPGNFPVVSGFWLVSHNTYTQISAEGGIPAIVLYVLLMWRGLGTLRNVGRSRDVSGRIRLFSMALQASIVAYLVGSCFGSLAYQLFPYCLVAYSGSVLQIVRRDRKAARSSLEPELSSTQIEVPVWQ
jgi:putative inorganic carbon (HCO3(-)) transporter